MSPTESRKIRDFLVSEYERQSALATVNGLDQPKLKLQDCVRLILELAEKDPLIIIIDSVDSVDEEERRDLLSALRDIAVKADNVVKILSTSRSNSHALSVADKKVQITTHEARLDMEAYIRHQVHKIVIDRLLLEGDVSPSLQTTLVQALLDGAGENFLWVKLQIERLCREKNEANVVAALEIKLPEDPDQLYSGALNHVFKTGDMARDIAVTVFSWILHMQEPLTPSAFLDAIAAVDNTTTLQLPQLLSICANLVVLDTKCNVLRFADQSFQEFLKLHKLFSAATSHSRLLSACIQACARGPIPDGNLQISPDDFYVYAAMYWPVHFELAQHLAADGNLSEMVFSFIFDESNDTTMSYKAWIRSIQKLVTNLENGHTLKPALEAIPDSNDGPIFLASMFGLNGILDKILSKFPELDINARNHRGNTPVYVAADFGYAATVTILVDKGAEVNVECGRYGSPLHAACFRGHMNVPLELLKLGASIPR